ncbi:hypothetical protein Mpsy_1836 [Methanolobus psychrophilus R15]|nr:hypothetical protein Mpsy_1836 [Methanolobus psychrophilus R15]
MLIVREIWYITCPILQNSERGDVVLGEPIPTTSITKILMGK